jgi:hypothetical protein
VFKEGCQFQCTPPVTVTYPHLAGLCPFPLTQGYNLLWLDVVSLGCLWVGFSAPNLFILSVDHESWREDLS